MNIKSKIQCSSAFRQYAHISFRSIHIYLFCKQIQFEILQEIQGVGFRIVQNFTDMFQEGIQLTFALCTFFVFPVCCQTFFRNFIHPLGADLYFYPSARRPHYCCVQGLIAITFRYGNPVSQTLRAGTIEIGDDGVNPPAIFFFLLSRRIENDANGEKVKHLFECNILILHLVPDGMHGFRTAINFKLEIMIIQFLLYRFDEFTDILGAVIFCFAQLAYNVNIYIRLGVFQTEVFQLRFDLVQAQSMCQRCIDKRGFGSNFHLLIPGHTGQGTHVMQPVC
ncbi:hypothetical protein D3C80_1185600 [compost metagenome]